MASYNAHCIYGYFVKDVRVTVSGRLSYQPYAQAGYVEYSNGDIALISYESEIFRVNPIDNVIDFSHCTASPIFSRTTARHVGSFCKQFCPELSYHDIKNLYLAWPENEDSMFYERNGWTVIY